MSNLSHYIIEDVNSLYSSIYLSEETEVDEVDAFAGDVYAFVAHSMLHEGYSASGILGFLSTAPDEEILEKFGDYNENFISESTISEEYVNEQVEQLDEFVGAALRILGAGAKAAKYAKGATGLAPLSRMGAALKGAGTATTRVAKQGPGASSVVRAGLSKLKSAAGAGLAKLKGAASKLPGPVGRVAKTLIPGAAGFALGRGTSPKGDSPSKPKTDSAASTSRPQKPSTPAAAPPKAETKKPMSKADAMAAWAKANPKLAAAKAERDRTRGTSATTNPLMSGTKSSLPAPKPAGVGSAATKAATGVAAGGGKSGVGSAATKAATGVAAGNKETKKEAYDVVLDYLLSEGHADTVEEAHYIMLRLEADHVQEIVTEGGLYAMPGGSGTLADVMRQAGMHRAPVGQGRGYTPPATPAPVKGASLKKKPNSKNVA